MFRIVVDRARHELLFEGFGQDRAQGAPNGLVRDTQEETVISRRGQYGIVFGVVADVELHRDVLRVARYGKDRTKQPLPSRRRSAGRTVIGVRVERLVGSAAK